MYVVRSLRVTLYLYSPAVTYLRLLYRTCVKLAGTRSAGDPTSLLCELFKRTLRVAHVVVDVKTTEYDDETETFCIYLRTKRVSSNVILQWDDTSGIECAYRYRYESEQQSTWRPTTPTSCQACSVVFSRPSRRYLPSHCGSSTTTCAVRRRRQLVARTFLPVLDATTSPTVFVAGIRFAAALPLTPGQSFSLVTFVCCYCLYVLV